MEGRAELAGCARRPRESRRRACSGATIVHAETKARQALSKTSEGSRAPVTRVLARVPNDQVKGGVLLHLRQLDGRGPLPHRIHRKEAGDDDGGTGVRVEEADAGDEDGPVDTTEEAHDVGVDAAALGPELREREGEEREGRTGQVSELFETKEDEERG